MYFGLRSTNVYYREDNLTQTLSWTDGGRESHYHIFGIEHATAEAAIPSGSRHGLMEAGPRHYRVHLRWWRYVFRGCGTAIFETLLW